MAYRLHTRDSQGNILIGDGIVAPGSATLGRAVHSSASTQVTLENNAVQPQRPFLPRGFRVGAYVAVQAALSAHRTIGDTALQLLGDKHGITPAESAGIDYA